MTLNELKHEISDATLKRNTLKKDVLKAVLANTTTIAIAMKSKNHVTEDMVKQGILKEQKTLAEMIETCPEVRVDLLETYKEKKRILDEYAPKIITNRDTIRTIVKGFDIEKDNLWRGRVMGRLKSMNVDMKTANQIVTEIYKEEIQ